MLSLLATLALTPITYGFLEGQKNTFDVDLKFEGFVPVLGGQDGVFDVHLGIQENRVKPDKDGNLQTTSELVGFKLKVNGGAFPIGLDEAQNYFPKTTVSNTPEGKVLKTDAPEIKLPVRLPGLDIKRFPDISYLPIEFPVGGIEEGKTFTYTKKFGESDVSYEVKPTKVDDKVVEFEIKLKQHYDLLEDDKKAVVEKEADATAKVSTDLEGAGKATFDRLKGVVTDLMLEATATSKVEDITTHAKSDRKLKTTQTIKVKSEKAVP